MSTENNSPEFWWWYFPITGLEITDAAADLEHPLFKDATIISVAAMKSLIQADPSHHKEIKDMAINAFERECDSVLAIRHALFSESGEKETFLAQERSAEIMSGLLVFAFDEHGLSFGYGPSDLISYNASVYLSIREDGQRSLHRYSRKQPILFGRKNGTFTRKELAAKIGKSRFAILLNAIFETDVHIHESVRIAMLAASRRFATACYMNVGGEIVASTITCFELFLKQGINADKVVQARLEALIGFPQKQVARLYDCRNLWVHEGVPPEDEYVKKALFFVPTALLELIRIAQQAPKQTCLKSLIQYFDLHALIAGCEKEQPGVLHELYLHFDQLNPFQVAARRQRIYKTTLYILSETSAATCNWFYSTTAKESQPCLPLIEFAPSNVQAVANVLKIALYEQDKKSDYPSCDQKKLERNEKFSEILGCTCLRDLRRKSLQVEISLKSEFELKITRKGSSNKNQTELLRIEREKGILAVSKLIVSLANSLKNASTYIEHID